MLGIDLLKEKLVEMGFTRQQSDGKVVYAVLSICAECPEVLDIYALKQRRNSLIREIECEVSNLSFLKSEQDFAQRKLKEERDSFLEEVSDFKKNLVCAETDEAKASLRKAQFFMNNVKVETKYDNTAYIAGLAAILSEGKIDSLKELHKMNPSISDIKSTY